MKGLRRPERDPFQVTDRFLADKYGLIGLQVKAVREIAS